MKRANKQTHLLRHHPYSRETSEITIIDKYISSLYEITVFLLRFDILRAIFRKWAVSVAKKETEDGRGTVTQIKLTFAFRT